MILVSHICPEHGWLADASAKALVYCGAPGCREKEATGAPEGVDPKTHRRAYFERARARVGMRNIRSRKPLPQADPESNEALAARGAV